jgi:hypothetical protein
VFLRGRGVRRQRVRVRVWGRRGQGRDKGWCGEGGGGLLLLPAEPRDAVVLAGLPKTRTRLCLPRTTRKVRTARPQTLGYGGMNTRRLLHPRTTESILRDQRTRSWLEATARHSPAPHPTSLRSIQTRQLRSRHSSPKTRNSNSRFPRTFFQCIPGLPRLRQRDSRRRRRSRISTWTRGLRMRRTTRHSTPPEPKRDSALSLWF